MGEVDGDAWKKGVVIAGMAYWWVPLWRVCEVVVGVVGCVAVSRGPRRPNVFLQEANVALKGPNVTLKGHDVIILLDLGF